MEAIFREAQAWAGPMAGGADPRFPLIDALHVMRRVASGDRVRSMLIDAALEALLTGGHSEAEWRAADEARAAEEARADARLDAKLAVFGEPPKKVAAFADAAMRERHEGRAALRRATEERREANRKRRRALADVYGEDALCSPEWASAVAHFARAFARSLQ